MKSELSADYADYTDSGQTTDATIRGRSCPSYSDVIRVICVICGYFGALLLYTHRVFG